MSRRTTNLSPLILLQILGFLCFTLPFRGSCQVVAGNQEKTILLNLKQYWSNPASISHWTSSSDHCTWPEITCTNGSVTGLELINGDVTETIPPFICDLQNLSHIDLQFNYIPGFFPKSLYNCSKLQYLDLSQNYFIGTVPDDIDRLSPRLRYLNLGANNFTGDIPSAIGRLQGLRSLQLFANLFNGSFPPEIGNLSDLEELVLNYNGFSPQSIPLSFTQLKKLRNLWMTETNLVGEIPEDIGNMTSLEFLDLSVNGLTGSIPDGVFQLKNLTTLFLHKNRLSGSIPLSVEALNLKVIDLSNNSLTGRIPEDFGKLTNLTGLALFFNQLSGEIPVSLGKLPALVDFGVFNNNLHGELPPDFGRYSFLETFQVSSNHFVGRLPEGLCDKGVLLGVVAFGNNLTGELPGSLNNCNSLRIVRVHNNRFYGEVPEGLWRSLNLSMLMISDNTFTGQLPEKVAANLSLVEIGNNQFSGELPQGISSWENLRVFKASNNLFNGTIPQGLTALPHLTTLSLDGNRLSGQFPSNITSWKSLTSLNLSRNQLSGQIPAAIGSLPDLTDLDLSRNGFSGEIPPEIGFRRLTSLNLSSNHLSGRIPFEFQNAAFENSFLDNPGLCSDNPSLGLRSCRSKSRKSNKLSSRFIAAASSIAAVGVFLALVYTFFVIRSYRKKKQRLDSTWKLTPFQRLNFSYSNILSSLTENNVIGSGGSGKVYRVPVSRSGEFVAVKKIWNDKKIDAKLEKEFLAEVHILGTLRHSNIVKLMCCISSTNSKLLVYEYMENRSLDRWLHGKRRSSTVSRSVHHVVLDWPKRLQIAIGAAQGLCYMHHDCSPPVIHRDVKSSNVLLDSDFNAKIADFGLARIMKPHGEPNTVSTVAGSFGYIAPEYAHTARVNEKIDVYSFGVILLELVTGREASEGDANSSLAEWAWRYIQGDNPIANVVDEDIKEQCYMDEISSVFKLGVVCTGTAPSNRPTMKEVLQILLRYSNPLPTQAEKKGKSEYDVAPLLKNSKRERMLEDQSFDSMN